MLSYHNNCHTTRLVLPSHHGHLLCYSDTYSIYEHNNYNSLCIYYRDQRSDLNSYSNLEVGHICYPEDNGETDRNGEANIFYHCDRGDNYHYDNHGDILHNQIGYYVLPVQCYDHEFLRLPCHHNCLEADDFNGHFQDSNYSSNDDYDNHERPCSNYLHNDEKCYLHDFIPIHCHK